MQNKKVFSAVASLALAASLVAPAFAAGEYLDDVENVFATSVPGGIEISWDAVANADGYTIYFGANSVVEDGGTYEKNIAVENVTKYTVEDLLIDTIYYFSVAADDSTGTYLGSYNYSDEVSAIAGEAPVIPDPEPVEEPEEEEEDLPIVEEEEITGKTTIVVPDEEDEDDEDDEATLPDSGPATAAVLLASAGGAYFYRKFRK